MDTGGGRAGCGGGGNTGNGGCRAQGLRMRAAGGRCKAHARFRTTAPISPRRSPHPPVPPFLGGRRRGLKRGGTRLEAEVEREGRGGSAEAPPPPPLPIGGAAVVAGDGGTRRGRGASPGPSVSGGAAVRGKNRLGGGGGGKEKKRGQIGRSVAHPVAHRGHGRPNRGRGRRRAVGPPGIWRRGENRHRGVGFWGGGGSSLRGPEG